jgi:hypothetical protein
MNVFKTRAGIVASVAAVAAVVAACIPCCIPLVAPILAWLGVTSLGAFATGWYWAAIGVFALGAAAMMFIRFRRGASCQVRQKQHSCACGPNCGC